MVIGAGVVVVAKLVHLVDNCDVVVVMDLLVLIVLESIIVETIDVNQASLVEGL